ncbi:hypothetical protein C1645_828841 [Glomus cerebriforme]|uniref:Uncharacterized protein n=1 Tax=Glomus cerebriforme TaxID=658196 RepID=A0A397SQ42_9GLOM|nr:hypothetical protein C1645_828841 [Glomus cerebriforme]
MDLRRITWIAHCDARIDWKKSLNIHRKDKRSKISRHHTLTSSSGSIVGTDQSKTSHHSFSTFSNTLWLIWASSNFLHSGSWTHHRTLCLTNNNHSSFSNFISSLDVSSISHPLLHDPIIILDS